MVFLSRHLAQLVIISREVIAIEMAFGKVYELYRWESSRSFDLPLRCFDGLCLTLLVVPQCAD